MKTVAVAAKIGATVVVVSSAMVAMTGIAVIGGTVKAAETGYLIGRDAVRTARWAYNRTTSGDCR